VNHKLVFPTYRRRFLFVRDALERLRRGGPIGRMLNLGCGEGDLDAVLAAYAQALDCCDVNEADVEHARRINGDLRNVRYRVEDAARLPYPDGAFDVVVSTDVIEHVDDPQAMLNEVERVLASAGSLVLTCPSAAFPATYDPINALLRPTGRKVPLGAYAYGHSWLVRDRDMRDWLVARGFQVEPAVRLSRSLAGLVECYVPGIAQKVLKANAGNRRQKKTAVALRPSRGEPALVAWTDRLIAADERWFAFGDRSVGLGYVAHKREP
jgi:SAM-dependent methyltransferase